MAMSCGIEPDGDDDISYADGFRAIRATEDCHKCQTRKINSEIIYTENKQRLACVKDLLSKSLRTVSREIGDSAPSTPALSRSSSRESSAEPEGFSPDTVDSRSSRLTFPRGDPYGARTGKPEAMLMADTPPPPPPPSDFIMKKDDRFISGAYIQSSPWAETLRASWRDLQGNNISCSPREVIAWANRAEGVLERLLNRANRNLDRTCICTLHELNTDGKAVPIPRHMALFPCQTLPRRSLRDPYQASKLIAVVIQEIRDRAVKHHPKDRDI